MTNKGDTKMTEIDVSGCKFYYDTYCNDDNYLYGECAERDCYYKQLKRLELENQELGKIINCKNGTIASLANVRDELKQENAKLKSTIELIKEYALDMEVWSYIRKDLLNIIGGTEE